jgi:hypothetical protein
LPDPEALLSSIHAFQYRPGRTGTLHLAETFHKGLTMTEKGIAVGADHLETRELLAAHFKNAATPNWDRRLP